MSKKITLPIPAGQNWCDVASLMNRNRLENTPAQALPQATIEKSPDTQPQDTGSNKKGAWVEVSDPYAQVKRPLSDKKTVSDETKHRVRHQEYVARRDCPYLQSSRDYDRKRQRWQAVLDKLQNKS